MSADQPFAGVGAGPEGPVFALGTVVMAAATLYFLGRAVDAESARPRTIALVTTLVPLVAFGSYLALFLGVGVTEVTVRGRGPVRIYWARYADWLFTTPLLLIDLGLLAGADGEQLLGAVAADAFMIATGLVAALARVPAYRYVWWAVSAFAFLLVVYFLAGTLTEAAGRRDPETASTFVALRNLTVASWALYPVWWLVGVGGVLSVSPAVGALGFALLDVVSKVGFGLLLLRSPAVGGAGVGATARPSPDSAE